MHGTTMGGECVYNKCYISQLFSNASKDLRPYLRNVYIVLSNRHPLSPFAPNIFISVYFIRLCREPHNYRSMCTLATYCIHLFQENAPETGKYEQEEKQEECYSRYFPFFFPHGFFWCINIVTDSVNNVGEFLFVRYISFFSNSCLLREGGKNRKEKLKGMEHKEIREGTSKQNQ